MATMTLNYLSNFPMFTVFKNNSAINIEWHAKTAIALRLHLSTDKNEVICCYSAFRLTGIRPLPILRQITWHSFLVCSTIAFVHRIFVRVSAISWNYNFLRCNIACYSRRYTFYSKGRNFNDRKNTLYRNIGCLLYIREIYLRYFFFAEGIPLRLYNSLKR